MEIEASHFNAGGGAELAYINDNERPDLIFMGIDSTSGDNTDNTFRYKIGWDLNTEGSPKSWSAYIEVDGIASATDGGGAAVADINGNDIPDLIFMGVDDMSGSANLFGYRIGWDLDINGKATRWSERIRRLPAQLSNRNAGGGAAVADIDENGRPDLILMGIDDPSGDNTFKYEIGWDLKTNGTASKWSSIVSQNAFGYFHAGGGVAIIPKTTFRTRFTSPAIATANSKANVAVNQPVAFKVGLTSGGTFDKYRWWQEVVGEKVTGTAVSTTGPDKSYTHSRKLKLKPLPDKKI